MAHLKIVGNLAGDPEEKTSSGKTFWKFNVIENFQTKSGDAKKSYSCTSFKKVDFKKGDFVEVYGLADLSAWFDEYGRARVGITVTVWDTPSNYVKAIEKKQDANPVAQADSPF